MKRAVRLTRWWRVVVLAAAGAYVLSGVVHAQSARYDPTTDPNVQSYMVCIQLASGGGDNSGVPDASNFDNVGYVTWSNGLGKFILCQEVEKP